MQRENFAPAVLSLPSDWSIAEQHLPRHHADFIAIVSSFVKLYIKTKLPVKNAGNDNIIIGFAHHRRCLIDLRQRAGGDSRVGVIELSAKYRRLDRRFRCQPFLALADYLTRRRRLMRLCRRMLPGVHVDAVFGNGSLSHRFVAGHRAGQSMNNRD